MVSTEEQIDWLATLIRKMDADGIVEFEAEPAAERVWVEHVNGAPADALPDRRFYYSGAEVAGKPRVFMPYSGRRARLASASCSACAAGATRGFALPKARRRASPDRGSRVGPMRIDLAGRSAVVTGAGGRHRPRRVARPGHRPRACWRPTSQPRAGGRLRPGAPGRRRGAGHHRPT